jgi:hypothetical protein
MNALKESYEKTEKEDYMIMLDLIEDLGDEWFTEDWKDGY